MPLRYQICIRVKCFFSLIHRDALEMLCPKFWPILPKSPLPVDLLRVRLGTTWFAEKQKWRFARMNEKL